MILKDREKVSFEAKDVTQINKTNNPPINTKNKI